MPTPKSYHGSWSRSCDGDDGVDDNRTADAWYQLGTVLALQGKSEEAIAFSRVRSSIGCRGTARREAHDSSLRPLCNSAGFKTVVADARRRASASKLE